MRPAFSGDASKWTLTSDQELLDSMAASSAAFLAQANAVKAAIDKLEARLESTKGGLHAEITSVLALAQTQFIENRVAEVKEKSSHKRAPSAPVRAPAAPDDADVVDDAGEKALIEQLEANLGDLDPLNERPLPHIIGTDAFFQDAFVGLGASLEDEFMLAGSPPKFSANSASQQRAAQTDFESLPPPAYDLFADPAMFQSALFPGHASLLSNVESPIAALQTSSAALASSSAAPSSLAPTPPLPSLPINGGPPAPPPRLVPPSQSQAAVATTAVTTTAAAATEHNADLFGDDVVPFAAKPRRGLFDDDDDDDDKDDDDLLY